jgi:hypothetical protein
MSLILHAVERLGIGKIRDVTPETEHQGAASFYSSGQSLNCKVKRLRIFKTIPI